MVVVGCGGGEVLVVDVEVVVMLGDRWAAGQEGKAREEWEEVQGVLSDAVEAINMCGRHFVAPC